MLNVYTQLQTDLKVIGLYDGILDGKWGPKSQAAFLKARELDASTMPSMLKGYCLSVAWSAKVSPAFIVLVKEICLKLECSVDKLMSCMAFETGETFSPTIANGAGAPYYGLIQFGKAAAIDSGTTIEALLKMTAEDQLVYVYRFFKPYAKKLKTISDIYMRILWPAAVGKPEDYVIFNTDTKAKAYFQNKGLDVNKNGKVTKAECAVKVSQKLALGLDPKNLRVVTLAIG